MPFEARGNNLSATKRVLPIYEHRSQPLISHERFIRRQLRHGLAAILIILASLALGVAGYRFAAGFGWVDSVENAAMILGGMGQVSEVHSTAGKLFASFYALFAGVVFLVAVAVLLAPAIHRILHHFHLESNGKQ